MKNKLKTSAIIAVLGVMTFASCTEQEAPKGNIPLDKHGSVEINVSTSHEPLFDLLKTEKSIYDDNGSLVLTKTSYDTLPKLKIVRDTLSTGRSYTDDEGNDIEIDTVLNHPQMYQIFITVK